jgi:hypothetical protein
VAIAHIQSTGNFASGTTSVSKAFVSNNTAGNLLVAAVVCYAINTPTISDTRGNTWTQAISFSDNSLMGLVVRIFYAANCSAGANTVTGSWTTANGGEIHLSEFSGAATTSPLDKTASGSGVGSAGTATTTSVTTTQNGELVWGWCGFTGGGQAIGSGFSAVSTQDGDLSEYKIQTTAGSVAATWSTTSDWVCAMATFATTSTALTTQPCFFILGFGS